MWRMSSDLGPDSPSCCSKLLFQVAVETAILVYENTKTKFYGVKYWCLFANRGAH